MKKCTFLVFLVCLTSINAQDKNDEPEWYQMNREGRYLEVASHLLYQVLSDSTRNKHLDYIHIARSYGKLGDYEKASFYLKRSVDDIELDEQFRWYYEGTLAFFERDKDRLEEYYKKLKAKHTDYYKSNYLTVKSLYENFDKSYLEASNWKKPDKG